MRLPLPLHLYVHIPFCVHKCAYCDFNSHVRARYPWPGYGQALVRELKHWAGQPRFAGRPLASIFFGGGTPSLAPANLVADFLEAAERLFGLEPDAEISLEANPGSAEAGRFADYRAAGVNRLSIGVQSFDDQELDWLERIHSSHEAAQAYAMAREAGFDNINLDLIYGLPGQQPESWLRSLEQAINLGPEHLSCYQLTVEPGTRLAAQHARRPLPLPQDEPALRFFTTTRERLDQAGFEAYEISNFARPGRRCRHNDSYWLYHDYIGIGAGAAGKWDVEDGGVHRYSNIRSPEKYMAQVLVSDCAVASSENLTAEKASAEAVWLGLRRKDGINRAYFSSRFGVDVWQRFAPELLAWRNSGHLALTAQNLHLTPKGIVMADTISAVVL
ncbi:MAG: radical SAM family heme chaperone HemW [Mariprofundaceae bacterium]